MYSDNRIEIRYDLLSSLLIRPASGDIIPPWSKPINNLAPEELNTPDSTNFPDDIFLYLSTTIEEARLLYKTDLDTHVTNGTRLACPHIMDILTSDLKYDVFVPNSWTGIKMEPYHLDTKPDLPDHIRAKVHSTKTPRQNLKE